MRKNSNGYYTNRHSCFLLQYHLVLVTKYRHPVLSGDIKEYLEKYTLNYFKEQDLVILTMNIQPDHMHVLFEAKPNINMANFINAFKTASSRMVRKNYDLSKYYWKPYFWSLSYFLGTVSEKTTSIVEQYIKNQ